MFYSERKEPPNPEHVKILLEFLEVTFNSILYSRKLYPDEIFSKKKIYGISVKTSRYPGLNKYIKCILTYIEDFLKEDIDSVKKVNIVIQNDKKVPVEKFVIQMDILQQMILQKTDFYFEKIEDSIKKLLLSLATIDNYLQPLPSNLTFTISLATNLKKNEFLAKNFKFQDFPWKMHKNPRVKKGGKILPMNKFEPVYCISCYSN
ncbi:mitotic spindle assembly checkpoint protein MAD2B-like [Trichogramma pretiosum]|uniref:mitotic spindle assembly checkpoint protein MAD2B-like n=1 Tax=Trichogramma pretiosum TaxID=7493 RepID=UPI0006C95690|nr:mitotic spindle assembly checkpoint protein MAD2B-like [Trichogramma pretiosum]